MRRAGMVHVAALRSISSHRAPRASPERTAHRTRNSSARRAERLSDARTRASAAPTSACGSARKCALAASTFGSAAASASPAGLSGRCPCAIAHFITAAMRCRTRVAVVCRSVQIGVRTSITSAVSTACTGMWPILGMAWVRSDARHCASVPAASLQVRRCMAMTVSAASANVGEARPPQLRGSPPARAMRRFSHAAWRASARVTRSAPPRPMSRRTPWTARRCTHDLPPPRGPGFTSRYRPLPSP